MVLQICQPQPCNCECWTSNSTLINGVRIDPLNKGAFIEAIVQFLACGQSHVVHFVPADPTVIARRNSSYRDVLNRGTLNVADGMSIVWALKLYGARSERIPGTEAFLSLCDLSRRDELKHFLYGGTIQTLGALGDSLERQFPGIKVVGSESPPFRDLSAEEILTTAAHARSLETQFFWVGLGTPKQDYVAEVLQQGNAAPVILCVGAAFDFVAGSKQRAPEWICRSGLEWLHRLAAEPRRLWRRYLIGNPQFVLGILKDRSAFISRRRTK